VHNFKVRTETSAEDVGGMHAAVGILTARGGMTSHAAVVARGWGKCCVAGCSSIHVNDAEKVIINLTYKSLPAHI
jgi:pyruvate,orthophosphate dikinase